MYTFKLFKLQHCFATSNHAVENHFNQHEEALGARNGGRNSIRMTLQLADRSIKHPHGVVEDVLVKVDKIISLVDFFVIDIEENIDVPLILGRPFIKIAKVIIGVDNEKLKVRVQDEEVNFSLF